MSHLTRGVLIALEGIDGSGKSTLAKNLANFFQQKTIPIVLTKEPGGTLLGKQLRTVLQERKIDLTLQPKHINIKLETKALPIAISPKAEYLLFAADRAQHMQELIQPSLAKNMMVLSDRMGDSAVAYQGYGRGLDINLIKTINAWAMNTIKPHLTLYVKVDVATALNRIIARNEKPTSFEQEKKDFFQRIIDGFDTMYTHRDDVIIIDGQQSQDNVLSQAIEKVTSWLKNNLYLG